MNLLTPLEPLTRKQRLVAAAVALICAASRFLAAARTLWDWDEALFCLGMRSYDVSQHHPHPPGFPTYIALAKGFRLVIHDDFRSLQAVNLTAGMLLFPAMFLLARELRLRFDVAVLTASLCAFFPNVWFFGGTAFSDVVSLTLVVFAVALLIRGCRDRWAYFAGTLLLALSIGIRPQNFLVGFWPGLVATRFRVRRGWGDVVLAALLGAGIVAAAYGAAVHFTGTVGTYLGTIRAHAEYISRVDSFHSPDRPALWRVFNRFFFQQYQSKPLSILTSLLVLAGIGGAVRSRDRRIGLVALAFIPLALAAWLMLDRYSVSRFSIGYCPLFAVLAVYGIDVCTRHRQRVTIAAGFVLIVAFAVFTWPALALVRRENSPTFAAAQAVRQKLDVHRDSLYVAFNMVPFAEYLLPDRPWTRLIDDSGLPLSSPEHAWLLAEVAKTKPRGFVFQRQRKPLWEIARRQYFVTALEPFTSVARYVSGWYDVETAKQEQSRWMRAHSVTILPAATGPTVLRLVYDIPDELMSRHPAVTVTLNGKVVDRSAPSVAHVERDFDVDPAPGGATNVLDLQTDRTLNPAREHLSNDPRDLGLLIHLIGWGPQ